MVAKSKFACSGSKLTLLLIVYLLDPNKSQYFGLIITSAITLRNHITY